MGIHTKHTQSVSLHTITDPDATTITTRRLTAAERVLGLIVGHLYKVTGTTQTERLFFVRDISPRSTWNSNTAPNTRNDLIVTFHHTPITEINALNHIQTAGNVYDITDPNTHGQLTLNASLLDSKHTIDELPPDATWHTQNPNNVQPLTPVDTITHLLQYSIPSISTP